MVTSLSLIAMFSFFLLGREYSASEITELAVVFVVNSVLAAGIAYLRQR
jgi:hypothetical protein